MLRLSPVSITIDSHALPPQQLDGVAAGVARPIGDRDDADRLAVARDEHRRASRARSSRRGARESPASRAAAPRTADGCPARPGAADVAFGAAPGERRHVVAAARRAMPATPRRSRGSRCAIGCFDRCSTDAARRRRRRRGVAVRAARRRRPPARRASACRSCRRRRSGRAPARSRCAPPLISTPLRAAPGQRRDDRHRRRDHERARARDDEQHERAIDPGRASGRRTPAAARRRRTAASAMHRRRVDAREPLDERLRRRALRLRLLDQVDDARERRVAPERVTRTSSAPRPLMRAGKHLVARRLVDRQRLAGDRRLVDRALRRRRPRRRAESSRRA